MGNTIAREAAYERLSTAIPPCAGPSFLPDSDEWNAQGAKAFTSKQHRQQFVKSLMILLTDNGKTDLTYHNFSLMRLRRDDGRIGVVLVAINKDTVEKKIEAERDGKDAVEAFCCFVEDIEARMRVLLQDVPHAVLEVRLTRCGLAVLPAADMLQLEPLAPSGDPPAYKS